MALKLAVVYEEVVAPLPPDTFAQLLLPFEDCCHCMLPVWPLRERLVVPPLETKPELADAVPPTETGLTVIVPVALTVPHPPVNRML